MSGRSGFGGREHVVHVMFARLLLGDGWLGGVLRVSVGVLRIDDERECVRSVCAGPVRLDVGREPMCRLPDWHVRKRASHLDLHSLSTWHDLADRLDHVLHD